MLILFLKRIKRKLSKAYHRFKMAHGHLNVVHLGVGSYKKYSGGVNNTVVINKNCVIDNPLFHIVGNNNKITFEEHCHVGPNCSFWLEGNNVQITIGKRTTFTNTVHVNAQEDNTSIEIGEDCMFSNHIIIRTSDSHAIYSNETNKRINPAKPIRIGNHVWIAPGSEVMKGVVVGDGCIIGSQTMVTKDVPANCLVVGRPARVVKENIRWTREDVIFHKF